MRTFLIAVILYVVGACSLVEARQPNVVFILADDLGYTDVACYGSKYYETPNIDRLAAEGMRFTNGYTCGPNCQPTRAALMSGQYGPRTGVYTVGGIDRFDWQSSAAAARRQRHRAAARQDHARRHAQESRLRHRHVRQVAPRQRRRASSRQARLRRSDRSAGEHFDFKTNPPTDYPEGAVPRRLPDRPGRRLHRAAQGRAVLPVPAALRRPLAAPGEAGADRRSSKTSRPSAATTIRPTPR